jgi:hypothetical protein
MPPTSSAPLHGPPPRVTWSLQAKLDLELAVEDPAVQQQLKDNAEETLHEIEDHSAEEHASMELAAEEGRAGEVMWHRGWTHAQQDRLKWEPEGAKDGPWNYVMFYRKAAGPAEFEVLAVRSRSQLADRWEQLNSG